MEARAGRDKRRERQEWGETSGWIKEWGDMRGYKRGRDKWLDKGVGRHEGVKEGETRVGRDK